MDLGNGVNLQHRSTRPWVTEEMKHLFLPSFRYSLLASRSKRQENEMVWRVSCPSV